MKNIFNSTTVKRPVSSLFDLSHQKKMSVNMGMLYPILCQEVLPGDTFRGRTELLIRMAPMIAPIMHQIDVYVHYFFVPNRLVWNDWEDFITGGASGEAAPLFPQIEFNAETLEFIQPGSLADYLGIPTTDNFATGAFVRVNALPFRAYQLIYDEWYRDQNLIDPIEVTKSSGIHVADSSNAELRKRAWEKDYFTSALPWTQRGGDVHIPFSGDAPIIYNNETPSGDEAYQRWLLSDSGETIQEGATSFDLDSLTGNTFLADPQQLPANMDPNGTLYADMSAVTSSTIDELRKAITTQQFLEINARAGSRYTEVIQSHFGVRSKDSRLQRPEFLGSGKQPIVISEVLQTSETETTPQGNMAGHGVGAGSSNQFHRFFTEHGYIIGMLSIRPRSGYFQGIPRHFLKRDKFDFAFPTFANLGEQEVFNGELYLDFNATDQSYLFEPFGYQSRYAEYKYNISTAHGEFRTNLDYWHMMRKFSAAPNLNQNFVEIEDITRPFAVEDDGSDKFYIDLYHSMRARRMLPRFGIPSGLK